MHHLNHSSEKGTLMLTHMLTLFTPWSNQRCGPWGDEKIPTYQTHVMKLLIIFEVEILLVRGNLY